MPVSRELRHGREDVTAALYLEVKKTSPLIIQEKFMFIVIYEFSVLIR